MYLIRTKESLQYCKLSLVKSMLHKVKIPYYKHIKANNYDRLRYGEGF